MSWAAVISKPQSEHKAVANVARQGFECWLPEIKVHRVRNHRKVTDVLPLFPRYFFARVEGRWRSLLSSLGVADVVRSGNNIPLVSDKAMAALRMHCEELSQQQQTKHSPWHVNQVVLIGRGPFAGRHGVYKGMAPRDRALILLQWLGAQRAVYVAEGDLTAK